MEDKKATRPAVFVGSSVESLDVAYAVQENLEHVAEVTVWTQGIFEPSGTTLTSLERCFSCVDFAIFVFAPDDLVQIRREISNAVRDNVIFELGLATGKLGRERSYILKPRTPGEFRLPTDLLGITPLTFDPSRIDGNLRAALGPACNQLTRMIKEHGSKGVEQNHNIDLRPIPNAAPAMAASAADTDSTAGASSPRKDDEVTRFANEIVAQAEASLALALRPQGHSRWAGVYGQARYYRLWYQNRPWNRDHFKFQLWLESPPGRPRTLWVGFSLKPSWLEESGYPPQKSAEIRQIMTDYAKRFNLTMLKEGDYLEINYEITAPELSKSVIEHASIRLFALINELTPTIDKAFPSES